MSNSWELAAWLSVPVFVVSSMLGMGLSLTIRQIFEPFHSARLVLSVLVANFVAVPLAAFLITRAIPLDQSCAFAVLLLGTASGAPYFQNSWGLWEEIPRSLSD